MNKAHAEQANHVVISQVYGGGGNAGAPYNLDFIELYNPTDQDVSLDNWSIQYASSTGNTWTPTELKGTIKAHGYYLIAEKGGTVGVDLPTPDVTGSIAISATSGKVVLLNTTTLASGTTPAGAIDLVGFGGSNTTSKGFEGTGPTPAPSNTTGVQRRPYANVAPAQGLGNAWDSDDNAADFAVTNPTARNTASPTESPMIPKLSLQPKGTNIQFNQQGNTATIMGKVDAVEPNSTVKIYETASKGTPLTTATAQADGSFTADFTKETPLSSIYVSATQTGLDESDAIAIDLATASKNIDQTMLSYVVTNGKGTLIGNAKSATANAIINVYPTAKAESGTSLLKTEVKADASGGFNVTIDSAPDTVYVTQITNGSKGIMLESAPVSVTKADTSVISKIKDVREPDANGKPVNLNKVFTIEGVATVNNQILGTQKQNFYIQDETAGINIFGSVETPFKTNKGDRVRVTGKVLIYNGLLELEATSIEKISEGNSIPDPKPVTILDLTIYEKAEPLEGSLVTVTGKVSAVAVTAPNYNVTFVDENNKATTLRVMGTTGIKPETDLEINKSYTVTGIVGQYTTNASPKSGYQVFPRDVKDIAPILGITHSPIKQVYKDVNVDFEAEADGADSVTVYYKTTDATDYTALKMDKGSGNRYTATLPKEKVPQSGFQYYIEAKAGEQTQTKGTKTEPYTVAVIEDKAGPEITGLTPQDNTKVESPRPEISALINDPSGIKEDSVKLWLDGKELKAPQANISKTQVKYTPEEDLSLGNHKVKVSASDNKGNQSEKEWTFEVIARFTGGHHYRGTTHNHTNISHDAAGTPEDALKAGKAHHYDWFAFSDHSHDIDPEKLGQDTVTRGNMQERSGGAQWQQTKDLAKQYTKDDYVVFPAFEMTSTTWGHSNIFGTDNFIDRNINGKQYQDLSQYYAWVLTYDDIVGQFNHPDMSANAFNNFKPYNKEVDKLFTMLEVGNGSGHYGYANAEKKFYSALDLGWHIAPTYGEDNHDGTWGQTNARTVIVADSLKQESLLHAMRNMRVYMEEDPNFQLDVLANGYYMGSTVDSKSLKFDIKGDDPVAEAHNNSDYAYLPTSYKSDDRIKKVELITNGGKVVDTIEPMTKDFTWKPEYTVSGGQQWFVVKVTQMDGEQIYSSPIWSKEESVDVKVNDLDVNGGVVIDGNPAKLTATVANNGTEAIKNLKVDFYYDEVNEKNLIDSKDITSIPTKGSSSATVTWPNPLKGDHKIIVVVTSKDGLDIGKVEYTEAIKVKESLGKKVLIDANHGNENTSADGGTYKDNLKAFTLMLQKEGYTVTENKTALTDDVLKDVKVLVFTNATKALTDDEKVAVNKFVQNGGSLFMAGKSNNGSITPDNNNALLAQLGSAIRISNDGVFDDSKTGNFWSDPAVSPFAVRIHPGLVSNYITDRVSFVDYYSGASLSGIDNKALEANDKLTILAKGNETTYQKNIKGGYTYDNVSDDKGGSAIPLIATEEIGSGRIIVSGMNFFNDKQMDEAFEPKGNDELAFNSINWLAKRDTKVQKIAEIRKLSDDTNVVIEGTVTTAAGVFFDAFYLQDDTGGIMAFQEVPAGSLKEGDKVRVYGHMKTYENNKELEFTSFNKDVIKLKSGKPLEPKTVLTGQATTAANQGLLVKVKGKVVSKFDENSYVINDGSGDLLVFTDGYIVNQSNIPVPNLKAGDTLEAVGLSGSFSQGTRIRVRDTRELVGTPKSGSDSSGGSGSGSGNGSSGGSDSGSGDGSSGGKPTPPITNGVENNTQTNKDVVFTLAKDATATLDGKEYSSGTKITAEGEHALIVTDKDGKVTIIKFTIDKTAPTAPKVGKVSDKSTKISGKTEANATVKIYISGKYQGSVKADKSGNYSFNMKKIKAGTTITIKVIDNAGNISKTTTIKVEDKTPPNTPKVDKITANTTKITGKAEAGSTVYVKSGNKIIAKAIANKKGEFAIKLPKQKAGKVLTITSKDKAGNTSKSKKVIVKK